MTNDRVPLPLQAVYVTFTAALVAGAAYLAWVLLRSIETTRGFAWLAPVIGLIAGIPIMRLSLARAASAGMVEPQKRPLLTSVVIILAASSVWLGPLLPSFTGPRNMSNRNAAGLNVAVPLLITWIGALIALLLDRRLKKNSPG